jgi:hypothetical protein
MVGQVTSFQLRHRRDVFTTITQHQNPVHAEGEIWISGSLACPLNAVTGVSCGLCGSTAITISPVLGIPEDLGPQTCVFVGSEMWPRNLAVNVTIMVTCTVCFGVLYVLKKTLREQTRSYCLLPSVSAQTFRWIFMKFCSGCWAITSFVKIDSVTVILHLRAQMGFYAYFPNLRSSLGPATCIPNPPKPTVHYDFPTLYFPLKASLLTGEYRTCLVPLTFLKSDSGKEVHKMFTEIFLVSVSFVNIRLV